MPKNPRKRATAAKHVSRLFGGRRAYLIALFAYVAIAFIVFYPTIMHPLTNVPGIWYSDKYQSMWDIWRIGHSVFTLHQGIWYSNLVYWPTGASLIFETAIPMTSLLAYPFALVSLPLAYNFIFLFGMVFSGLAMMLLADYILENKYAAFIAGVIFAFSAFHIAVSYGDVYWSNIGWIPLSVYLFLGILDRRYWHVGHGKYLNVAALSASFVLMFYGGGVEQMVMTLMAFVVILLAYFAARKTRALVVSREFLCLMALSVLFFVVLDSWAISALIVHFSSSGGFAAVNFENSIANNVQYSDNLLSYVTPSFYNGLFDSSGIFKLRYDRNLAADTAYIGFTVLALAVLGLYKHRRKLYLWAAVCIVFFLISLGPYLQAGSAVTGIPGLYLLLKYLPVVGIVREPGRFAVVVSMALAVMAAWGAKIIFERVGSLNTRQAIKLALLVGLPIIILAETAAPPLSAALVAQSVSKMPAVSSFYGIMAQQKGVFGVLELPIVPNDRYSDNMLYPSKAMFTTIYSGKPVIGGYISRISPQQEDSELEIPLAVEATEVEAMEAPAYYSPINENYTNQTILFAGLDNVSYVTLDKSAFAPYGLAVMERYLTTVFGSPVYQDNTTVAYSTSNAIASSLFHGFVGYPELALWNSTVYHGQNFWIPNGNGTIDVYAPGIDNQSVDTAVGLTAVSLSRPSAVLGVWENTSNGVVEVASFNLTATPSGYGFDVLLKPGAQDNRLYFIPDGGHTVVGVTDITFAPGTQGADTGS